MTPLYDTSRPTRTALAADYVLTAALTAAPTAAIAAAWMRQARSGHALDVADERTSRSACGADVGIVTPNIRDLQVGYAACIQVQTSFMPPALWRTLYGPPRARETGTLYLYSRFPPGKARPSAVRVILHDAGRLTLSSVGHRCMGRCQHHSLASLATGARPAAEPVVGGDALGPQACSASNRSPAASLCCLEKQHAGRHPARA